MKASQNTVIYQNGEYSILGEVRRLYIRGRGLLRKPLLASHMDNVCSKAFSHGGWGSSKPVTVGDDPKLVGEDLSSILFGDTMVPNIE